MKLDQEIKIMIFVVAGNVQAITEMFMRILVC
jgi:hypothetical protein